MPGLAPVCYLLFKFTTSVKGFYSIGEVRTFKTLKGVIQDILQEIQAY